MTMNPASFTSPTNRRKQMIIIGLFSKGGEAVRSSSTNMINIYMPGQERVRRRQRCYPRRDETPQPSAAVSDLGDGRRSCSWNKLMEDV